MGKVNTFYLITVLNSTQRLSKNKILFFFDFIFNVFICSRLYPFFGIAFRLLVRNMEIGAEILLLSFRLCKVERYK